MISVRSVMEIKHRFTDTTTFEFILFCFNLKFKNKNDNNFVPFKKGVQINQGCHIYAASLRLRAS